MLLSVSKGNLAVREHTANLANLPRIGISVTDDFWEVVGRVDLNHRPRAPEPGNDVI
jgi:hypothetical protein